MLTHDSNRPFQATMFRETEVNIGPYATLNMTNINEGNPDRRYALDTLRANCSLSALVDANERYDPPRCAEATRRGIIQQMEDWVRHDGHHSAPLRIFWLYGGAGAGKSALAQTLAEKFKTNEDLAASFFFFGADVNRNDGNRLIPTIVLQLIQSFQGLTPFVAENILRNPDLFKKSRQTQMLELLIEPLIRLSLEETNGLQSNIALKSHPRLVVIDGLDECLDSNIQRDLLQIIGNAIPHFPYPLCFLITSRPESHITRTFQNDLDKVAQYDLSDDSAAAEDIRKFLDAEFEEILRTHPLRQYLPSHWPPRADINSIVERSSSHFIYACTVCRFIQSPKHRPDDRLSIILGLKEPCKDRPYARLDSLYSFIFLKIQEPGQLEKIHRALGIMYLRSLHLRGLFAWPEWTSDRQIIEVLLQLRPGDLVLLFDDLLSLVTFAKDDIRILHKSLYDYLLDSSRSGDDLHLDLGLAYQTAVNYILRGKKRQDTWDLTEFQHFAYHCQFARLNDNLVGHIRTLAHPKITFTESLARLLEEPSLFQSILYFLQAISRQDFDSSGHCYQKYVEKVTRYLRPALSLSRRLKSMTPELIRHSAYVERNLRLSFKFFDWSDRTLGSKGLQLNALSGSTPVPVVNAEHEMCTSYVNARYLYLDTVVSFLEPHAGLVHSCHFGLRQEPFVWAVFIMLATYTKPGVRLSCSEFELARFPLTIRFDDDFRIIVEKHHQSVMQKKEVDKNRKEIYAVTTTLF